MREREKRENKIHTNTQRERERYKQEKEKERESSRDEPYQEEKKNPEENGSKVHKKQFSYFFVNINSCTRWLQHLHPPY